MPPSATVEVATATSVASTKTLGEGHGGEGVDDPKPGLPIPEKGELKYPVLGSHLNALVLSVESGAVPPEEAAAETPIHRGASVAVTIHLTGSADDVAKFLAANGGDPRNVGEDYIEAYVPVTVLGVLSQQPDVISMRAITPPNPGGGG